MSYDLRNDVDPPVCPSSASPCGCTMTMWCSSRSSSGLSSPAGLLSSSLGVLQSEMLLERLLLLSDRGKCCLQ